LRRQFLRFWRVEVNQHVTATRKGEGQDRRKRKSNNFFHVESSIPPPGPPGACVFLRAGPPENAGVLTFNTIMNGWRVKVKNEAEL